MRKPTCFVIQPFDKGKFDKRYVDVFKPAIDAADLSPYRVDADPSVTVPIESIERGIQESVICLADITEDNPNVWYELGFSFASGKPVVMISSEERQNSKYPFDIQHRSIISYKSDSTQDFDLLKVAITTKLKALLKNKDALSSIARHQAVEPISGLSSPELAVLVAASASITMPEDMISVYSVKLEVEKAGLPAPGFAIGFKRLRDKKFIATREDTDYNGETYMCLFLEPVAWDWIEQHEEMFLIRSPKESSSRSAREYPPPPEDDIPF